jgi:hypothetical protein
MLEAFWEFDFPEMNAMGGKYQITEADKRKMVGENLAEAHNFDIENLKRNLPDDEFSRSDEPADPYSLSSFEVAG